MKNLVLIGMPGAAKSTTGRIIAKKLNRPFFDGDEVYVSLYRETPSETFESHGEAEFRRREVEVYKALSGLDGSIIACGGGVVLNESNMNALKTNGIVVLITATPEAIYERVSRNDKRPLLRDGGIERVKELLKEREPLYEKYADFRVDNTYIGAARCADRIIALYKKICGN